MIWLSGSVKLNVCQRPFIAMKKASRVCMSVSEMQGNCSFQAIRPRVGKPGHPSVGLAIHPPSNHAAEYEGPFGFVFSVVRYLTVCANGRCVIAPVEVSG